MDPTAWVLNLDVEDELSRAPRPYTRPRAVRERIAALAPRLGALTGAARVLIDAPVPGDAGPGRAWCPTPSALALLRASGATPPRAPALGVLATVLHRRFAVDRGLAWAESRWLDDAEAVRAQVERGGAWRAKRAYGYAGRGHRLLGGGALGDADQAWLARSIADGGGVLIEPELEVLSTPALHGHVGADGRVHLGAPTLQRTDAQGAWLASERTRLDPTLERALSEAGERAAAALREAGYFGAFGIDAVVARGALVPLGELNARYTMGWAIGMDGWRAPPDEP